jgi:hypothetical protein
LAADAAAGMPAVGPHAVNRAATVVAVCCTCVAAAFESGAG